MSSIDLKKLIPKSIRNDFFSDFMDSWSEELTTFKTDISVKEDTFNVRNLADIASLQEICSTFGYYPSAVLDGSVAFFKSEIRSIAYRIKRKTTYGGYDYIFKSIPVTGYVYNLYYDGVTLVRAVDFNGKDVEDSIATADGSTITFSISLSDSLDYLNQSIDIQVNSASINVSASNAAVEILTTTPDVGSGTYTRATGVLAFTFLAAPLIGDIVTANYQNNTTDVNYILDNLVTADFGTPFTSIFPQYYYSFIENNPFTLDETPVLELDTGLYLDTNIFKTTTHHITVEVFPLVLTTVDTIEYLASRDQLDYVLYYTNYNRKVTDIPHVGPHIAIITDDSRFYNNLNGHLAYTVPDLKLKFAVTQDYNPTEDIDTEFYEICAGTGAQAMFAYGSTPGTISALANQIFSKVLSTNEKDNTRNYVKIDTYIPNESITNLLLFTGDGCTSSDSGTLAYQNIIPSSVYLSYYGNNTQLRLHDDGLGNMLDPTFGSFVGTIDYELGTYSFNFYNDITITETIATADGSTLTFNTTLVHSAINLNSGIINGTYNSAPMGPFYTVQDGSGNFTVTGYLASGVITGDGPFLGTVSVLFTVPPDAGTEITVTYTYRIYSTPALSTEVLLDYKTNDAVPLTEIGIKNFSGDLVAYGLIQPIDAVERPEYFTGMTLMIQK